MVGSELEEAGPHGRSAAHSPAHALRSRDDQVDGLLPRHRELLAALFTDACPASRRQRCSIIFRAISCCLSTRAHQTVPQVHGMWHGDRSRKQNLVDYGFRLPSALDNRPLKFEEFENRMNQTIYVSATPGPYELTKSAGVVVEQIIRPTGLVDPEVEIRPVEGPDRRPAARDSRSRAKRTSACWSPRSPSACPKTSPSITPKSACAAATCTLRSRRWSASRSCAICARASSMCSSASTCCAKGLDLPEVSLVAILDADKEGFLRSAGSLIQTIGRCARHLKGRAILYADSMTDSMKQAIGRDRSPPRNPDGLQRRARHHAAVDHQQMDMGLAQILKAEYGEIEVEEAAGLPEFNSQAGARCLHRQTRNGHARSRQKIRIREGGQAARQHQGTARQGIPVRVRSANQILGWFPQGIALA